MKAQEKLLELKSKKSDINEHLQAIHDMAEGCSHITEFGVRDVVSTWALLAARPKKLVCYDINHCPVQEVRECASEFGIEFCFFVADVLTIDIEETDILLIDTLHTYHQLFSELTRHAGKVRSWILMHDTETYAEVDEKIYLPSSAQQNHGKTGLVAAINEFLSINREWERKLVFKNNNGLTVLGRVNG